MKGNLKPRKIVLAYIICSISFFLFSYLLYEPHGSKGQNLVESILTSLGNLLYWVTSIAIYMITLLVSAGIGMYITHRSEQRSAFLVFRSIGIIGVFLLILGLFLANA